MPKADFISYCNVKKIHKPYQIGWYFQNISTTCFTYIDIIYKIPIGYLHEIVYFEGYILML